MKTQMTADEIRKRLEGYKVTYIQEKTGLHYNTIRRFLMGADSKSSTIEKLSVWLERNQ